MLKSSTASQFAACPIKDFHLLEDGQPQTIQNVAPEAPGFAMVSDNFGKHPETIGSGGGRWSYPDIPSNDLSEWLAWPKYVIAYVPPPSPTGSCHQIHVKVGRSACPWSGHAANIAIPSIRPPTPSTEPTSVIKWKQISDPLRKARSLLAFRPSPFLEDSGRSQRLY